MRAAAIDRFGGIETITLQTLPVPEVGPDELLIRVESAGVGAWDPFEREGGFAKRFGTGEKFPYVLGTDGAGTVVKVGEQVNGFKEGDRVYAAVLANPKGGFYAELAAVKADNVARVPGKLTTEQAGVMVSDALTALQGLDDMLGLKPGETLMIFGAGGVAGGTGGFISAVGAVCASATEPGNLTGSPAMTTEPPMIFPLRATSVVTTGFLARRALKLIFWQALLIRSSKGVPLSRLSPSEIIRTLTSLTDRISGSNFAMTRSSRAPLPYFCA